MTPSSLREIPSLEQDVSRVIEDAYFPTSPAATVREAIFSEILSGVLDADPSIGSLDEFYDKIEDSVPFEDRSFDDAIDVFEATYTTTGERGARGKRPKRYVIPFHPVIAEAIRPEETRNWGKWYQVLMTTEDGTVNEELHGRFVDRLQTQRASNIFEEVFIDAAEDHIDQTDDDRLLTSIPPYVPDSAEVFQEDLAAWLEDDVDSPSNWLQSTRDLFCFHFMNYYIQLSVNLRREFEHVSEAPDDPFVPEMVDIPFGMWDETASGDRAFTNAWKELDGIGLERDVYDSWGRLAALNIISETIETESSQKGNDIPTLSDALELPHHLQQVCIEAIEDHFHPEHQRLDVDIATAANRLANAVRHDYEQRTRSNQTPISMGINVVRQLGDGKDRTYIRSQRGVGTTLRLNKPALRFFARLFTYAHDETHYDGFVSYLRQRGIYLDPESQRVALDELEEMGMIHRLSDSGGAVYVRSI